MLNKRAPSFGYGHKVDISMYPSLSLSNNNSPSPDKYSLTSDFAKSPKKGLTIGHSREDCKSISIFNQTASTNPGPGNYNLRNDKENIKNMTMSPKLKFPSLWAESISPGPGKCIFSTIQTKSKRLTQTGPASSPNTSPKTVLESTRRVLKRRTRDPSSLVLEPTTPTFHRPANNSWPGTRRRRPSSSERR